jgi:hypothetical protein
MYIYSYMHAHISHTLLPAPLSHTQTPVSLPLFLSLSLSLSTHTHTGARGGVHARPRCCCLPLPSRRHAIQSQSGRNGRQVAVSVHGGPQHQVCLVRKRPHHSIPLPDIWRRHRSVASRSWSCHNSVSIARVSIPLRQRPSSQVRAPSAAVGTVRAVGLRSESILPVLSLLALLIQNYKY